MCEPLQARAVTDRRVAATQEVHIVFQKNGSRGSISIAACWRRSSWLAIGSLKAAHESRATRGWVNFLQTAQWGVIPPPEAWLSLVCDRVFFRVSFWWLVGHSDLKPSSGRVQPVWCSAFLISSLLYFGCSVVFTAPLLPRHSPSAVEDSIWVSLLWELFPDSVVLQCFLKVMDILFSFWCDLLRQEEAERACRRMESELDRNRFADVCQSFWANVYAEACDA